MLIEMRLETSLLVLLQLFALFKWTNKNERDEKNKKLRTGSFH